MSKTPRAKSLPAAPPHPDDLLTLGEIATLSSGFTHRTTIDTVRNWTKRGCGVQGMRGVKVKLRVEIRGGRIYVKRSDFQRFNDELKAYHGYRDDPSVPLRSTAEVIHPPTYPAYSRVRGVRSAGSERRTSSDQGRCASAASGQREASAAQNPL